MLNNTEVDMHPTTAFAWEYNVLGRKKTGSADTYIPTDETGARVDWYGCLNYKCCDVLKAWIAANRAYFFAASSVTAILLLIGVAVSLRIALHSESDATKMVSHKRDLCIAAIIFFVLVIGAAAVAYMATSIGNVPQKTTGDIAKDKNITSDLAPGGNASDVCRSPTAGTGSSASTCVSCENGMYSARGFVTVCSARVGFFFLSRLLFFDSLIMPWALTAYRNLFFNNSTGIRDGDELGTDCGGSCPLSCAAGAACQTCPEGDACKDPCQAGLFCGGNGLSAGVCRPPTLLELCTDNVQNHGEASLDCGFVCANVSRRCNVSSACNVPGDCKSGACYAKESPDGKSVQKVCVSCSDGQKNGLETDVDCGGRDCAPCNDNKIGKTDADCASGFLDRKTMKCASCSDGVVSRDKTDTTCGAQLRNSETGEPLPSSMGCPACADGGVCKSDYDCSSGNCFEGLCASCSNTKTDGNESDVDW